MAYWSTSVQTFSYHMTIAAFCSENFVCDENNNVFVSYFTYGFDFTYPIEIGYRWSSTVRLHLFECITERVIACE